MVLESNNVFAVEEGNLLSVKKKGGVAEKNFISLFFSTYFLTGGKLLYNVIGFCCKTMQISHNYTYIPSLLSLPFPSIPLLWVITKHRARLLALFSNFPLSVCFTHGVVYLSVILSQFIPPSPFPTVRFPQVHSLPGSSVPLF